MQFLWNRATYCIFLGIVLQSFCSIKLIWLNSLLVDTSQETFSLNNGTTFVCIWAVVTFFSRIIGGYTLGKYAEGQGFIPTQKILILGYIVTTFLFFLCCLYASNLYQIKPLVLLVAYLNAFLFPATLVLPAMHLMKIYSEANHVKISTLAIAASGLGYILSYAISAECNPQTMSCIIFGGSFLCGLVFYIGKKSMSGLEVPSTPEIRKHSKLSPNYVAKFLAMLVGGVCGAGLTHNYFFTEPYVLNVAIADVSSLKQGYIFFYIALGVFLMLASKICDYVNWSKLMLRSLIGTLLVVFSLGVYDVSKDHIYVIYQVLFAFFFAGFLAPSLALVFSLFKNTQPFFNGLIWYYSGLSLSYLVGYLLSKDLLGIFHHYFLFVSPLVFNGVLCIAVIVAIKLSIVSSTSKKPLIM